MNQKQRTNNFEEGTSKLLRSRMDPVHNIFLQVQEQEVTSMFSKSWIYFIDATHQGNKRHQTNKIQG